MYSRHGESLCNFYRLIFIDKRSNASLKKPPGFWQKEENVLNFIAELKSKFNLNSFETWDSLKREQILKNGGSRLLNIYSLYQIKCIGFPEGKHKFQQLVKKNTGYWDDKENIQTFLNNFRDKLKLKSFDDWNTISANQIRLYGGSNLLELYSLYDIKCMGFPEGKENFKLPKNSNYWKKKENIQVFLDRLKQKFQLNTIEDWNSLSKKQIKQLGASKLLDIYSIDDIKCMGFPDGKSLFINNNIQKPPRFWEDQENIQTFLVELKEKLNLQTLEDWKALTRKQIKINGGSRLVELYSMNDIRCMGFPEGKSKFYKEPKQKPTGYWNEPENIKAFLNQVELKFNLKTVDDWNSISANQIRLCGGGKLLELYSLFEIKCFGFPQGKEIFLNEPNQRPPGFWNNDENVIKFLEKLKENLNLNNSEDWNRISYDQIIANNGGGLIKKYSKEEILKFVLDPSEILPNIKLFGARSNQRWLFLQVEKLFPNEEIVEDYYHSEISRLTGSSVQFDIYLINKKIAIEYHGIQHYEDIPSAFAPLEMYQHRDKEKEKLCNKFGIRLIVVPYLWDNTLESLKKIIEEKR